MILSKCNHRHTKQSHPNCFREVAYLPWPHLRDLSLPGIKGHVKSDWYHGNTFDRTWAVKKRLLWLIPEELQQFKTLTIVLCSHCAHVETRGEEYDPILKNQKFVLVKDRQIVN